MSEKHKVVDSTVPTITVVDWVDLFVRPIYCTILDESLNYCIKEKRLSIHTYVFKEYPESRREWLLQKFSYEAQKSRRAKNYKLWQDGFHPVILDSLEKIEQHVNYIHYNPVEAEIVFHERDYVNSSYRNYEEDNGSILKVVGKY